MFGKVNFDNLSRVIDEPRLLWGEFAKLWLRINRLFHSFRDPVDQFEVISEDWQNLIILDGCRYDTFRKMNHLEGDLEKRRSAGSQSLEFLEYNFSGQTLHDTVYVTANPFATHIEPGTFHEVVSLLDKWDEELQTVPPETVVEAAKVTFERHPDKRFIVHFMQPHYPFIGPNGRRLDHRGYHPTDEGRQGTFSVWDELQYGVAEYDLSEIVEAYEENLDIVLDHVEDLIKTLHGKTVVTADHGNLLGERIGPLPVRGYGHPAGLRTPELVEVPWHVIDGERREITVEPPVETEEVDMSLVDERLAALGYAE